MPKITPSALISEIKGLWNGTVFQMWKGQIVTRNFNPGSTINKESRQQYKGVVSDLSGCYYSLTDQQKNDWICYADLLPTQMSGFNSFMARNSTLMLSDHPSLCFSVVAPPAYSPPATPAPFSVSYISGTDSFCLAWTSPALSTLFAQGFFAPLAGYDSKSSPAFRLISSVNSTLLVLTLDASPYQSNQVIYFKVRTINQYGEPSAYSSILSTQKT